MTILTVGSPKNPGLLAKRPKKDPKNRFTGPDLENPESIRGSRVLILRIRYSSTFHPSFPPFRSHREKREDLSKGRKEGRKDRAGMGNAKAARERVGNRDVRAINLMWI